VPSLAKRPGVTVLSAPGELPAQAPVLAAGRAEHSEQDRPDGAA
jgi:hypothetical protein